MCAWPTSEPRSWDIALRATSGAASTVAAPPFEREFGNLKHNFGFAFLRVRGIERVRLHAT
jgi:hypothetical protein